MRSGANKSIIHDPCESENKNMAYAPFGELLGWDHAVNTILHSGALSLLPKPKITQAIVAGPGLKPAPSTMWVSESSRNVDVDIWVPPNKDSVSELPLLLVGHK